MLELKAYFSNNFLHFQKFWNGKMAFLDNFRTDFFFSPKLLLHIYAREKRTHSFQTLNYHKFEFQEPTNRINVNPLERGKKNMFFKLQLFNFKYKFYSQMSANFTWKFHLPYISKHKLRIFGVFYKAKVGGSTYIRICIPQKK